MSCGGIEEVDRFELASHLRCVRVGGTDRRVRRNDRSHSFCIESRWKESKSQLNF